MRVSPLSGLQGIKNINNSYNLWWGVGGGGGGGEKVSTTCTAVFMSPWHFARNSKGQQPAWSECEAQLSMCCFL